MKIINVSTKNELDALYNQSALTWEGLDISEESFNAVKDWLNEHRATIDGVEPTFFVTKGKLMNDIYGLTGNNAYPDDLNIVSVPNIYQSAIILARFEVGGRWFDDVVDNNVRRERN